MMIIPSDQEIQGSRPLSVYFFSLAITEIFFMLFELRIVNSSIPREKPAVGIFTPLFAIFLIILNID